MLSTDFQHSFFLRTSKTLKNGEAPIYLRLVHFGKRKDISTKQSCNPAKWNSDLKMMNGSTQAAKTTNRALLKMQAKVIEAVDHLASIEEYSDLNDLLAYLKGEGRTKEGLMSFFQNRINEIESLIGRGYAKATLTNYRSTLKHLSDYLRQSFRREEIPMASLNYSFVEGFLNFLKIEIGCQTNSANKYLRTMRAVLYEAKKRDLISVSPFEKYSIKYERKQREFLSEEELKRIIDKPFSIPRISAIRDLFVFACFTGLSYADLKGLKKSHLHTKDGKQWLIKPRQKSKIESLIPLLPQAVNILAKYDNQKFLLPTPSNQKVNAYLKEIADLCGIEKNLTFHIARHTFATTVTLSNQVPIESVSRMLGHTSIKTTQIYARVVESKLLKDMEGVATRY